MIINFDSKEPIYLQIITYFKQQMVLGKLGLGEEVPSRRELATMLKVNANTVQRAYKEMEDMGMIQTVRNFPSTITTDEIIVQHIRKELIEDAVGKFIKAMEDINVTPAEIMKILGEKLVK